MKDTITDLCERLDLLRLRYNIAFGIIGLPAAAARPYIPMAEAISRGLLDADPAAMNITRALVDPAEMYRPEFWGTPLGRLLFAAGGFPQQTCTQTVAAVVLGCSRQWVSAMVAEEKLTPADGRGVQVEQVRQVLKNRANRLLIDKTVKQV
jgi:hypothetical protein